MKLNTSRREPLGAQIKMPIGNTELVFSLAPFHECRQDIPEATPELVEKYKTNIIDLGLYITNSGIQGLALPQIGVNISMAILAPINNKYGMAEWMINPKYELEFANTEMVHTEEKCINGQVGCKYFFLRARRCIITYTNRNSVPVTMLAIGEQAFWLQHLIDHATGMLGAKAMGYAPDDSTARNFLPPVTDRRQDCEQSNGAG